MPPRGRSPEQPATRSSLQRTGRRCIPRVPRGQVPDGAVGHGSRSNHDDRHRRHERHDAVLWTDNQGIQGGRPRDSRRARATGVAGVDRPGSRGCTNSEAWAVRGFRAAGCVPFGAVPVHGGRGSRRRGVLVGRESLRAVAVHQNGEVLLLRAGVRGLRPLDRRAGCVQLRLCEPPPSQSGVGL